MTMTPDAEALAKRRATNKRTLKIVGGILGLLVLVSVVGALAGGDDTDRSTAASEPRATQSAQETRAPEASPTARPSAGPKAIDVDVPWEDYATSVKTDINADYAAKDCAGLQESFDIADANGEATQRRTGHNNADLMRYIDTALRQAGCY